MKKLVDWIVMPDSRFGASPIAGRDRFLSEAFNSGIKYLEKTLLNPKK